MFVRFLFLCVIGSLNADYYMSSGGGRPCVIPRLDHGRVRVRQRSLIVKFSCLPRYELVGNRYATCKDGDWDVPLPVCVRPGCKLPNVDNGFPLETRNGAWVMYFCLPKYTLVGSRAIFCDGRRWNATAPTCVGTQIESVLSCDFEKSLCGWEQDELHDFDWKRLSYKTPSSFLETGPSFDHTYGPQGTGYYMYIESSARRTNDTARFVSPVYDRTLADDGCFSFFYHMYGRTTGGLRVYQKPDNLSLEILVHLNDEEKKKYILFEKWGSLGDFWFSSVSTLAQFGDNFQIVIEGIRGTGFTSDIAIDDVSILRGENCIAAKNAATTPSSIPFEADSCSGLCESVSTLKSTRCGCTTLCVLEGSCCPDFFDVCLFITDSTIADDMIPANSSNDAGPVTQRLVATTTDTTTSSTTSTSTTTTPKPTTVTQKPTTVPPKPTTTTPRPTTTTPKPSTSTTTLKPTTTRKSTFIPSSTTTTTIKIPTKATSTTRAPPRTMKSTSTIKYTTESTTIKVFTKKSTTTMPFGISRTIENHDDYHELLDKEKKEQAIATMKIAYTNKKDPGEKGSSNGWKIALCIVGVLSCVSLILVVIMARTTRGRITIAGLRGRISNDPDVQFLPDDVDDL